MSYNSDNYSERGPYGTQNQGQNQGQARPTQPDSTGYAPAGYSQGAYVSSTPKPPSHAGSQTSGYGNNSTNQGNYGNQGNQGNYGNQGNPGNYGNHGNHANQGYGGPNQAHGGPNPGYGGPNPAGYGNNNVGYNENKPHGGAQPPTAEPEEKHDTWKTAGTVAAGLAAAGLAAWAGKEAYEWYDEKQQNKKPHTLGPNEPRMPNMPSMWPGPGGFQGGPPQQYGGQPQQHFGGNSGGYRGE
ncbi:hypothetical protein IWQ60_005768 [Tieghemiomyces parasiticus]|uniref:Uncharacterized protein n=1 Tax=Tieghemiomyces parasiticus TaxID=78921 RepID=A0A9W8AE38_9FUNG|nr:hypothetical protein IWQ60_005768 [Tieghemiomyces parasiticus]